MKIRILLGGAVFSAMAVTAALAQYPGLFLATPTGNETVNIQNVGPQIVSVYLRQVRDAAGYTKTVATTGFSLTFANGQSVMALEPAGTLGTGTITMAANPVDGQNACFFSTQTQSALTLAANTGQTINNAITAMTANTRYCYIYSLSNTTWDRTQ
jgi:hypothetical protein